LDFAKQYIIQCITAAANNLRLSSEKIETVAILRERIESAVNLSDEIKYFKKTTELSKLGIKISELQNFIESSKIDFFKLTDKFKEHSYSLVKELSNSLDLLTPQSTRVLFGKEEIIPLKVDLSSISIKGASTSIDSAIEFPRRSSADELREAIILEELDKEFEFNFENYEEKVLRPVKELDTFLNKVIKYDYTDSEINSFIKTMRENGELSQKVGFEVLSNMHNIISKGLDLIHQKKIAPSINIIESLRACLIVIVAVIRGKEVDITNYLSKAENFGKVIFSKQKGI
jgi:hypothetical protein